MQNRWVTLFMMIATAVIILLAAIIMLTVMVVGAEGAEPIPSDGSTVTTFPDGWTITIRPGEPDNINNDVWNGLNDSIGGFESRQNALVAASHRYAERMARAERSGRSRYRGRMTSIGPAFFTVRIRSNN